MYESVTMCGASFIDDLSAEEVNVHGKRVIRDYMAGIVHVREQLAAARERRKRRALFIYWCLELVDVRRLKLQQFTQLFTCENDAQQAIKWLEELHETLLKDYNQIGSAEDDLRYLREDRLKLEDTARIGLNEKLEQTWGRLCRALSENEAKLNVTEAFNTTIVECPLGDSSSSYCIYQAKGRWSGCRSSPDGKPIHGVKSRTASEPILTSPERASCSSGGLVPFPLPHRQRCSATVTPHQPLKSFESRQ
ncbi:hypothetical protein ANCCEY_13986 [Ancylostoma ceylanicum]|uniref:SESTD1-like spectrin repeats region domain-containing protein n=1 Tax=Ancylostoma ceylanicum TaxID=53326 RepID=A0A0D6L6B1_9BILA|nr:hypothetical protein ANCCEY_13986 [Ancylostoma ceylanicum]